MGYDVFRFGALYLDAKIQAIPKQSINGGDIPQYDGHAAIYIGPAKRGKSITWIKPNGLNLLIADRILLNNVSWENLNKKGFIEGKPVLHNGDWFRCRLLQVGEKEYTSNEWDKALDETGENNALWHWNEMYFLGAELSPNTTSTCVVRGYCSARFRNINTVAGRSMSVGFRPALEPLPADDATPNINLDGIDFRLSNIPGNESFCPILQPIQKDVFADIPGGEQVKMYTFMVDGHPVHKGEQIKDLAQLTLTDRYFGDEYLIPWTISNGVAVSDQSLQKEE